MNTVNKVILTPNPYRDRDFRTVREAMLRFKFGSRPYYAEVFGPMIAAKLSDVIVVTSDNPRSEAPDAIIEDILAGVKGSKVKKIIKEDRTQAIAAAMAEAEADDIIILAGKGHETYQILNTGKIHYDEREVIRELMEK